MDSRNGKTSLAKLTKIVFNFPFCFYDLGCIYRCIWKIKESERLYYIIRKSNHKKSFIARINKKHNESIRIVIKSEIFNYRFFEFYYFWRILKLLWISFSKIPISQFQPNQRIRYFYTKKKKNYSNKSNEVKISKSLIFSFKILKFI